MKTIEISSDRYVKVSVREKIGYGFGDLAANHYPQLISKKNHFTFRSICDLPPQMLQQHLFGS